MILLVSLALASSPVQVWDLEQDNGGFLAGGELGQWRWGAVTNGPGAGYDGSHAWAVGLTGAYLNDAIEYLEVPLPPLDAVAQPVFSFAHWYAFGVGDVGTLEIDEGFGWRRATPIYGYPSAAGWSGSSAGWEQVSVELPALADVRLRFVFEADTSGVGSGWFLDQVGVWDGDVTAPRVSALTTLPDTEDLVGPYAVSATVEDDTGVDGVTLEWSTDRGESGSVVLTRGTGDAWLGELPAAPVDTVVSYHVVATDGANATRRPEADDVSFRVYLPAPTGLEGPEGRVVASTAELRWVAPVSAHVLGGYEVWRADELVAETTAAAAVVPLTGEGDTFVVRARYDVGTGDASEPVTVGAVVPALRELTPGQGYAGESLWVTLLGQDALFAQDLVVIELGEGAEVDEVVVQNVDRLRAHVWLDEDAEPGRRDLTLDGGTGPLSLPAAFEVLDPALRPQVLSVEPDHVTQGRSGTLTLELSAEPAALPSVSLGEGVVVERVSAVGTRVSVDYAVAIQAPIGVHEVQVDDGVRRLTAELEVRDGSSPEVSTCASAGGRAGLAALAGALLLAARRRTRR